MLISGRLISRQRRVERRRLTGAGRPGDEDRAGRPRGSARPSARASSSESPSSVSVGAFFDLSSRRMTTDSPSTVGSVATRMSIIRPAAAALSEIRPSCGLRRSAMSSFASTFRRVVTPAIIRFGMRCTSCSTPSMRSRTTSASSCGSKWMSLAPSSAAWKMIELTSRTSGTSEMPSSTSRSSASSSSVLADEAVLVVDRGAGAERLGGAGEAADLVHDVLARGDAELELVARREPQLVDRVHVAGVGDRDSQRVRRSSAYGSATTRSSTWSGISPAASSSTPVSGRSMNGSWKRLASMRASPSPVATPSSRSACAKEPPCLTPAANGREAVGARRARSTRSGRRRARRPR